MRDDLSAVPVGRNVYHFSVRAYVIILCRHFRRIVFEMSSPCEAHVYIFRVAISVQFPHSRHFHRLPIGVVESHLVEIRWSLVCVLHPVEFPLTFKREIIVAHFHVAVKSLVGRFISKEMRVHRESVYLVHLQVMPFGESRHNVVCRRV